MLAYFLKVNVAIVLFYTFYRMFFYKDTFFGWRRTALLGFFALSAAVPLMDIQTWTAVQQPMAAMAGLYASIVPPEFTGSHPEAATHWKSLLPDYAGILYWGGVTVLLARFFLRLAGILRLACRCRRIRRRDTVIHVLPKPESPFSFFRWIFIAPDAHTEEELDEILTHERAHVRQWHSVDVIVSEWACILCWFNPFVWLLKREIRTNLEYMADACVLEYGYDAKAYQYHLLGLSHQRYAGAICNSFNVLPLKKRIRMMNKKRTNGMGRAKYLMFLPLSALLLIISNIEAVARTTKQIAAEVIEKKKSPVPEDVVFEVVEEAPAFPENGMEGLMKYLSENIRYPQESRMDGTEGRVVVQFVVEADGSITQIHALNKVDPRLEQEAIRVVSNMPKWKPGKQRGQAVNVKFTIPVMFRLSTQG